MNWKACFAAMTLVVLTSAPAKAQTQDQGMKLAPATMKRVGQVDERYQSYNVEMLEVDLPWFPWTPRGNL
jgi:heparanase 1